MKQVGHVVLVEVFIDYFELRMAPPGLREIGGGLGSNISVTDRSYETRKHVGGWQKECGVDFDFPHSLARSSGYRSQLRTMIRVDLILHPTGKSKGYGKPTL